MDTTIVSAMAAVLGSLDGGSATAATAWLTQRTQNKREPLRDELHKREALYGELFGECAKLIVDAFTHALKEAETLVPLYAPINRMRLCASRPVPAEAEHLLRRITEQHFSKHVTVEELRDLARSGKADPMRAFGEACRAEREAMRARV